MVKSVFHVLLSCIGSLLNTQLRHTLFSPKDSVRTQNTTKIGDFMQRAVITYHSMRNKIMANVSYITVGGRLNLSRGRFRIYGYHQ